MSQVISFVWEAGADTNVALPRYETPGAAGADVRANLTDRASLILEAGARALVPTGLRVAIPHGFEMQVRPRSGLALKHGITLVNSPGTIDSDYRGPLGIILINHGADRFVVAHGDRIAQLVISPVIQAQFQMVDDLDETARGAGGFGSTGVSK